MRLLLIHVFCIRDELIQRLDGLGYRILAASVPAFVLGGYPDLREICNRHSIELFLIDQWNYQHAKREGKCTIPAEEQLRVVAQSERLLLLQELSITDRLTLATTIYTRCVDFLISRRIEYICFGGLPHALADYLMLVAAKAIGLRILVLQDLPLFPSSCIAYNSELQLVASGNYSSLEYALHFAWLFNVFRDVAKNAESSGKILPYQPDLKKDDPWASLYQSPNHKNLMPYSQKGKDYFKRLIDMSEPLPSSRFVSVFLHAEPEATVNPAIDEWLMTQLEMIIDLRSRVEPQIPILIREHPGMYNSYPEENCGYLRMYRSESFFTEIRSMSNIFIAHPEVSVRELILNSLFSVSSSGTVGFESLLFGIPTVGNRFSFLNGVPGFVNQQELNKITLETATSEITSMSRKDLLTAICLQSQPGSPNGSLNMFYKPDEGVNARSLAVSIDRLFRCEDVTLGLR